MPVTSVGLGDAALHLEGQEREAVRDDEQDRGRERQRERALEAVARALAQHAAAAPTARGAALRNLAEVVQQIAVLAGDEADAVTPCNDRPGSATRALLR